MNLVLRFAAVVAVSAVALSSQAQSPLQAQLVQIGTGLTTNALVTTEVFDTYALNVTNDFEDLTSASLSLPGSFLTTNAPFTFSDDATNPVVFGFEAPEAFIVLPAGGAGTELAVDVTDDASLLAASYSLPGTTPVVPLGTSTIAFLTVPTGFNLSEALFNATTFNGTPGVLGEALNAGISNDPLPIVITVPEPSTVMLGGLALVGIVAGRRRG